MLTTVENHGVVFQHYSIRFFFFMFTQIFTSFKSRDQHYLWVLLNANYILFALILSMFEEGSLRRKRSLKKVLLAKNQVILKVPAFRCLCKSCFSSLDLLGGITLNLASKSNEGS